LRREAFTCESAHVARTSCATTDDIPPRAAHRDTHSSPIRARHHDCGPSPRFAPSLRFAKKLIGTVDFFTLSLR
jgi:hypothetical protein